MLTERLLTEMVKQALKQHHAGEYQQLKADGSLHLVAQLRAEAAIETRDYLMSRARDEALASEEDPIERVRKQTMKNRQAEEIAIAQAIEFEPPQDAS